MPRQVRELLDGYKDIISTGNGMWKAYGTLMASHVFSNSSLSGTVRDIAWGPSVS